MRLLITTDTVGGVWTYTKELAEGLIKRGHSVLLISMGRLPSPDQQAWTVRTKRLYNPSFRYLATEHPLEWMTNNSACYQGAEAVLAKQIERYSPDILHLNQFCYGALSTDIPKVVIAHSDVLSWSEACGVHLPRRSPWFQHYARVVSQGLAGADAVVAPTRWMLSALCNHYAVPAQRAVIANGRALPAPVVGASRKLQAVTVGRVWDEGKNVQMLDDVLSPMPLIVAGELALESEPPFTSSRLQLLGRLSEEDALALFAESAIYIATSRYEPFGLAPLEAALCGCAIVAHDIPSLREVWGQDALYFKSAKELTHHLTSLHADAGAMARAADRAGIRARTYYSQDKMIESYLAVYERLRVPAKPLSMEEVAAQHVT